MSSVRVRLSDVKVTCKDCSLAELCLPRGLEENEFEILDDVVNRANAYRRGDYLFQAGDAGKGIYVVRSGGFKTCLTTDAGEEQVLGFHLPGELIGFDSFEDGKHRCTAQALEHSSVCELPADRLEEMCGTLPGLNRQVRSLVGREINADHDLLLLLGRKSAEERLAAFLVSLSERFGRRGFSRTEFTLNMPRQDIASFLGLAVETVSRLFARLQEEGLIEIDRRHVVIPDLEALKDDINSCVNGSKCSKHKGECG